MSAAVSIHLAYARANALANERLHTACAQLTAAELHAPRTSFFPTIMRTLNHILIVDWFYVDALLREGRGRGVFASDEPFAEHAELRAAQHAVDRKLLACAEVLDAVGDAALAGTVDLERETGVNTERAGDVLMHLFVHQIHHRGQVHAMLAGTRVAPPQLDEFFLVEDRARRAPELAALHLETF